MRSRAREEIGANTTGVAGRSISVKQHIGDSVVELILVLGFFLGLPIVYVRALHHQNVAGEALNVRLSLLVFVAVAATAVWALSQSRSQWGALGYLALPGEAALAGWLSLAFGRWRNSSDTNRWLLGRLALPVSALLVVFNVAQGARNIAANRAYDEYDEKYFGPSNRVEKFITAGLEQNPGRGEEWLDSTIRTRLRDSVFLSVAVRYDLVSPGVLDTLANSPFQVVAVSAIINQRTRAETLARSYRAHSDSHVFVQPLAHNPRTPPDILREIYHRHHNRIGIEGSLAENSASPRDVLEGIATSAKHPEEIHALLRNPALDCELLGKVASYLGGEGKALARDYNIARMNEVRPTVCSGKTAQ